MFFAIGCLVLTSADNAVDIFHLTFYQLNFLPNNSWEKFFLKIKKESKSEGQNYTTRPPWQVSLKGVNVSAQQSMSNHLQFGSRQ